MNRGEESELRRYLDPGERLLWCGSPRQGLVLRPQDLIIVPFLLVWTGMAAAWTFAAVALSGFSFFALFGVPFVLVGIFGLVGRFFVDARMRARTFYGLTEERIIILSGVLSRSVTSLPLQTLTDISLRERSDRTGTIQLGRPVPTVEWDQGSRWSGRFQIPSLQMIPDAKRVHDQILDAQQQLRPASPERGRGSDW